jgi:hypothetical protein
VARARAPARFGSSISIFRGIATRFVRDELDLEWSDLKERLREI